MDYFEPFENEDGLLEKLEGWVFVEWSAANKFVQDVNYPSNMLYAAALAAAGRMYDNADLLRQGREDPRRDPPPVVRRQVLRRQCRAQGRQARGDAQPQRGLPVLRLLLRRRHARRRTPSSGRRSATSSARTARRPRPTPKSTWPTRSSATCSAWNCFPATGHGQQILDESVAYLLYMAERTGTLWENVGAYASCNHGFASHIVHTLNRDILGVYQIDPRNRVVQLRFGDVDLKWCEGRIPLADGELKLRWEQDDKTLRYRLSVPDGYRVRDRQSLGPGVGSHEVTGRERWKGRPQMRILTILALNFFLAGIAAPAAAVTLAEDFLHAYSGNDASGDQVIVLWQFNGDHPDADQSGNGHDLTLEGGKYVTEGKFGGALEEFPRLAGG